MTHNHSPHNPAPNTPRTPKIRLLIALATLLTLLGFGTWWWLKSIQLVGFVAETPVSEPSTHESPVEVPALESPPIDRPRPTLIAPNPLILPEPAPAPIPAPLILRPAESPPLALESPAPTGQPLSEPITSPDVVDTVSTALQNTNIREGRIAWNPPEQMQMNEPEIITALISDDLQRDLATELQNLGTDPNTQSIVDTITVSSYIKVLLSGSNFEIETQTPVNQALPKHSSAEWRWRVTPQQEGSQVLYLSVYARIKREDGTQEEVWLKTYRREITIEVGQFVVLEEWGQWMVDHAEEVAALGGIVVAVTAFVGTQWRRLRKRPQLDKN